MFAFVPAESNVCYINKPLGDELDLNRFVQNMGGDITDQIKSIPLSQEDVIKGVAAHEAGGHCNQQPSAFNPDNAARLTDEGGGDQATSDMFRAEGAPKKAQFWIDLRAFGTSVQNGHATSILIDKPNGQNIASEQHLDAARRFESEMNRAVQKELGISSARDLLRKDPQKFTDTVDKLLQENRIGVTRPADYAERMAAVRARLGPKEDPVTLGQKDPDRYEALNRMLEAKGDFTKPETNPYIKDYIKSYNDAVKHQILGQPAADAKVSLLSVPPSDDAIMRYEHALANPLPPVNPVIALYEKKNAEIAADENRTSAPAPSSKTLAYIS